MNNYKILVLLFILSLTACGGGDSQGAVSQPIQANDVIDIIGTNDADVIDIITPDTVDPAIRQSDAIQIKDAYIVVGTTSTSRCDWSYFEHLTDSNVFLHQYEVENIKGVLFIQGVIPFDEMEGYRLSIADVPMLISTIAKLDQTLHNESAYFLIERVAEEIKAEAEINDKWIVAFDRARDFDSWGMITSDGVSYTENGCIMVMDAMAEATYNLVYSD